jgi:predicted PurR-regulated permease PerM
MHLVFRLLKPFTGLIIVALMAWYFSDLLLYIIIAAVLSVVSRPMARYLKTLQFRKLRFSHSAAAALTLLIVILIAVSFMLFFVPLINRQALMISSIDTVAVSNYFSGFLTDIEGLLATYNILPAGQSLNSYIEEQLIQLIGIINFGSIFGGLISTTGTIFMGTFTVLFLTFFFLSDETLLRNSVMAIVPENNQEGFGQVLSDSRVLLTRYLLGVVFELISMMTIISITLSILGIPNALLIGFLGGLMNIIPYLGPLIGASIGIVLGVVSVLSMGTFDQLWTTILFILLTFSGANLIDNLLLQPLIYSKSVKAHPIEILLVIIMAGKLAGIGGMILAIPVYTIIRLMLRQFLSHSRIVAALTRSMDSKDDEHIVGAHTADENNKE